MSLLDLAGRGFASLERLPISGIASLEAYDFTVDVSDNGLTSLDCPDASPNAKVLRQVEILIAQQNDLRDLLNVQFAFPNLVVLDVSDNALEAIVTDDQACLAELPALDTLIAAGNKMLNFALGTFWPGLKVIDLSSNALRDVPNFAPFCPNLVTVLLNDNAIDSLQHLAARLPPTLEQLDLSNNAIDDWHRLAQLTAFAETLTSVNVSGNDFCDRVKFSWRIFLAWLLPCAASVDGAPINDHEKDAVKDLFRDGHGGFSMRLLATMDEGRELELEDYLNLHCRVTVRPNHPRRVSPTPSRHVDPFAANASTTSAGGRGGSGARDDQQQYQQRRGRSPQPSPRKQTASAENVAPPAPALQSVVAAPKLASQQQNEPIHTAVANNNTNPNSNITTNGNNTNNNTTNNGGGSSAAVTQALQQLQGKVKVIQEVVKVLRQADLARRARAALVIQKYFRGWRARCRSLSAADMERLRRLKRATIVGFRRGGASASVSPSPPPSAATNAPSSSFATAPSSTVEGLTAQVGSLSRQVAAFANDMATVTHMAAVGRDKAARVIQTRYRGYAARKAFAVLKGAYKRFTAQYEAPATRIQSVVRMHLQRKKYRRAITKKREEEALKADNEMLKARVAAMERAMAAMLSRLETVEQLALLGAEADGYGGGGGGSRRADGSDGDGGYEDERFDSEEETAAYATVAAPSSGGGVSSRGKGHDTPTSTTNAASRPSSSAPQHHRYQQQQQQHQQNATDSRGQREEEQYLSRFSRPPTGAKGAAAHAYGSDSGSDDGRYPREIINRRRHAPSP